MTPRRPSPTISALAIRTRVIGTGNSFQVLIPLADIDDYGQTYRVIQGTNPKEFVPFELGIEPYTSRVVHMPQGFERYDAYKIHERAAKAKELSILMAAFPESHLSKLPNLWDNNYLPDKSVTLRIDRSGNLAAPGAQQRRMMRLVP